MVYLAGEVRGDVEWEVGGEAVWGEGWSRERVWGMGADMAEGLVMGRRGDG